MIDSVAKVVVPVDDQERALEFWTTRAGFAPARDETFGDERWIEVAPPRGGPVLVPDLLPHSPVEFPAPPVQMHFGWWAMFADPDGTRFALGQW